ncbi:response regulator [Paracoccus aminophilus]|uniref:Two component LuxR family transcriptional regulator n=1 Tax=Paracoccus aminophilus JCM 7686 TaxID=1367847 RepID=S5YJH6_PARAH|nr:response regulator [Paracoccus aminophilus]AGT11623.1 two component LuxR family transcriptional regulator [Paracoccus aminophilus JCM 7686]
MRGRDSKGLVLCIDDEADLLRDLADELREAGYGALEVASGEEALEQLARVQPDLILCDISMPGMDGYAVLQAVKAAGGPNAAIPFVFLTALAERQQIIDGKRLGADDYLVKPIDYDLMLATVEARLRQLKLWPDRGTGPVEPHWSDTGSPEAMSVLDVLATPVVVTDAERRVHFANIAARKLVEEMDGLVLDGGFCATHDTENRKLGIWLRELGTGEGEVAALTISAVSGEHDVSLFGVALQSDHADPRIAVFLGNRQRPPLPRPETLSAVYGLTPTEARISLLLAGGAKPAAIAATLGVSATTVAFHLRNIFEKTGADRQATLVGLLFSCPAISAIPD